MSTSDSANNPEGAQPPQRPDIYKTTMVLYTTEPLDEVAFKGLNKFIEALRGSLGYPSVGWTVGDDDPEDLTRDPDWHDDIYEELAEQA